MTFIPRILLFTFCHLLSQRKTGEYIGKRHRNFNLSPVTNSAVWQIIWISPCTSPGLFVPLPNKMIGPMTKLCLSRGLGIQDYMGNMSFIDFITKDKDLKR